MTAERAPARLVVTLIRAEHAGWWPVGYWDALVGCGLRMPAGVVDGRAVAGLLVGVVETESTIRLEFEGLAPED